MGKKKRSDSSKSSGQTPNSDQRPRKMATLDNMNPTTPIANVLSTTNDILYTSPQTMNQFMNVPTNTPFNSIYPNPHTLQFTGQGSSPNGRSTVDNQTLHDVIKDIYCKLQPLELIPSIHTRIGNLEQKFTNLETEIKTIKQSMTQQDCRLQTIESENNFLLKECENLKLCNEQLQYETNSVFENMLEMQTRSMRENLIFSGLKEVARFETPEQTEQEVKAFIRDRLEIESDVKFHVTHRLRPRNDGKPKSIVAKFESRKDRNLVLKAARDKLKNTEYKVSEQYPPEIVSRRNELWPAFRYHQQNERDNVKFYDDKLIVNGQRLYPSSYRLPREPLQARQSHQAPSIHLQSQPEFQPRPPFAPFQPNIPHYRPQMAPMPVFGPGFIRHPGPVPNFSMTRPPSPSGNPQPSAPPIEQNVNSNG